MGQKPDRYNQDLRILFFDDAGKYEISTYNVITSDVTENLSLSYIPTCLEFREKYYTLTGFSFKTKTARYKKIV